MESRGLRVAKAACEGFFRRDRVAPAYGIALQEIEVDRVVLSMPVREEMINSTEVCHGGILFLFADVIFGYACRTRNSQPGARISEHAKGRAIDIAAFKLHDGNELSVQDDWGKGRRGRVLRRLHESACGPFGTVLGPKSDRHHQDHFHFDTASYRSGAYCR